MHILDVIGGNEAEDSRFQERNTEKQNNRIRGLASKENTYWIPGIDELKYGRVQ